MKKNDLPEWLSKASYRIIEHMNDDHSNSIVSTLSAQHGIKDKNAKMEKLEVNGYFASSNEKFYFLHKYYCEPEDKKIVQINSTVNFLRMP